MRLEITDIRTLTDENPLVREMEFRKPPISIGSHSENLIQLPDISIAPYYATLDIVDDKWFFKPSIRDGLAKLDGQPITEPLEITDGQVIEISFFSIKFTLDVELEVDLPDPTKVGELAKIRQYPVPPRTEIRKADADVSLNAARQKSLSEFAYSLGRCDTIPAFLETTVRAMHSEFAARLSWMGVRVASKGPLEFMEGLSDSGPHAAHPPKYETYEYRCLERQQYLVIPRTGDEETQSVLAIPILTGRGALGLLYIDSRKHSRVYDGADLAYLTAAARIMAPTLEAIFAQQRPVSRPQPGGGELAFVRLMQGQLDPKVVPEWPGLQVVAYTKSGTQRAGDIYDIMRLPNGLAAILVARVTADLAAAAAAMAKIQGAFRLAGLHADPPRTQLKALNWMLYADSQKCHCDAAIMVMNPKTGTAELATAGRLGVLQVSASGELRKLGSGTSPPAGSAKTIDYTGISARLEPGHTLTFFTPGCVKAQNEAGEPLGEERFIEAVCDGFNRPVASAMEELLQDLDAFFRKGVLADDMTILMVHRPG